MAKKLLGKFKLQLKAGQATMSPPVGPAFGQRGLNGAEFVKQFNAKTQKEGGMVLEIGLRPATKQEMKMAKEMKPQKKANGGMVARGTGAAIRGKGFKGVF